tara:strand:- start:3709 stop:4623 length:915 start_codon:yes stop_codon:yes gene_type:complete
MIRQTIIALKQYYKLHKYTGGFMSRVSHGPKTHQYDTQIVEEIMPAPEAPSINGSLTIRRRYQSKVPILKPAKWKLFHELQDVCRIMHQLKMQEGYNNVIISILKKITAPYNNHNQTPYLISEFISGSSISKAIQRTSTVPINPRSEHFNPLQIVIGTLVARKIILPEANAYYEPQIIRAKLTDKPIVPVQEEHLLRYFGSAVDNISYRRRKEYERHYKLDPEHWYKYWPKNRHNSIKNSVQRFMYSIIENEHWCLSSEYYQKQAPNTWTLAPPPNYTSLVDYELKEREQLAEEIYRELFRLTH